nr:MAG TPA: hypothetical protein [Caudoviricetes sp.]
MVERGVIFLKPPGFVKPRPNLSVCVGGFSDLSKFGIFNKPDTKHGKKHQ